MFHLKSVRSKLMLLIIFVVLIPMTVVSVLVYSFAAGSLKASSYQLTEGAARNVEKVLNDMISDAEGVINQLSSETELLSAAADNTGKPEVLSKLQSIQKSHREYSAVFLGTSKGDMYVQPNLTLSEGFNPTTRPWYQKAVEAKGGIAWVEPYLDEGTGGIVITVSKAIKDASGNIVGVVGVDIQLSELSSLVKDTKIGENGYAAVLSSKGKIVAHPVSTNLNKDVSGDSWAKKALENKEGSQDYIWEGKLKYQYYLTVEKTGMKVMGTMTYGEITGKAIELLQFLVIVALICLAVSLLIAFFFARRITKPLQQLALLMNKAEQGDISVVYDIKSKDELGRLGAGFNKMMEYIRATVLQVRSSSAKVYEISEVLGAASGEVATAIDEVSKTIQEIARGASEQAVDTVAGAEKTQNLSSEIQKIIGSAQRVQEIAEDTVKANENGDKALNVLSNKSQIIGQSFNNVADVVGRLGEKSGQISTIIGTISSIATQTNLLALNAAIEAARAGEAGRGFAVVADEIRKLAEQSTASAKEVSNLVNSIQGEVTETVEIVSKFKGNILEQEDAVGSTQQGFVDIRRLIGELHVEMDRVGKLLAAIDKDKDEVTDVIQNISAVSEEAAAASEEVAASTEEVTASIQEITSTAEQLSYMAGQLNEAIKIFKIE